MHLAALELAGFKSFAKKTRLTFEPGITAIVGPNGSGKSAIADAIRWVLGEQSLKSIRAKRSEDVIFAGSSTRARLGMAEVSLTLADAEGSGLDTPELVLTRRTDRRGESTYLVNERPVRLLDLADLLARSGLAQKSYTVIPQGMIDSFVTASPPERRQMFEDATGVTPLILKQEQTERKLEATGVQVLRARDLLRELEPRLRALKRQAARARSRAEVEQELRAAEERFAFHRWQALEERLRDTLKKCADLDERIQKISGELDHLRPGEAMLAEVHRLPELRRRLEQVRAKERDLLLTLTRAEVESPDGIDRAAEEITARTKEREKLLHELADLQGEIATGRSEHAHLARDLLAVHEALRVLGTGPAPADLPDTVLKTIAEIQKRVANLHSRLQAAKTPADLSALVADAEHLARTVETLEEDVRRLTHGTGPRDRLRDALERLRELAAAEARAGGQLTTLQVREARTRERIRAVEDRLGALQALSARRPENATAPPEARARLVEVQRELTALNEEVARLERALLSANTEQEKVREEERRLRDLLHSAEQERASRAADEAAFTARKDDLAREVTERLGEDFLRRLRHGNVEAPPVSDPEALRAEIEHFRKRLFEIGGIDASVLAEESALDARVTELRTNLEDLVGARKNLRVAIRELEAHIHERFTEGFRAMSEAFNRSFREIFGGGRASLSLVKPKPVEHAFSDLAPEGAEEGPRDPSHEARVKWEAPSGAEWDQGGAAHIHELPAGVEIHVHPPGKKLTSLAQLSGGEKALTSIALLFAILSERMSPFVVLDEVDAALDEANSRRFARLLQALAARTQFIVITHNRATMEAAATLYGVTMGEDGISQLLSVKLADVPTGAEQKQAAA